MVDDNEKIIDIVPETTAIVPRKRNYLDERKTRRGRPFKSGELTEAQKKGLAAGRERLAAKREMQKVSLDQMLGIRMTKRAAQEIVDKAIQDAREGNHQARVFIWERQDGKAVQQVESNSSTRLHVTFERL